MVYNKLNLKLFLFQKTRKDTNELPIDNIFIVQKIVILQR